MYISKVIEQLNKTDKENTYFLYSNEEICLDFELNDNFKIRRSFSKKRTTWISFELPKLLKEDNIDMFWGTQYLLPKRNKYTKNIKFCLTIYDLAIEKLKNVGAFKNTLVHKLFLGGSLKSADRIIAISNATKKDIIELYHIPEEKIVVTYLGTNFDDEKIIFENDKKEEIQEKFKIKNSPYLFFISTIEPRKNIETLIKAFNFIKPNKNKDLKLILAGKLGWKYEKILEEIAKSKYKEDIIMPGYISKEEKKFLYQNTQMVVYPSLYEGFGLPVLEAMSNKALVVTSNNSSLPEVGGEAAFYYDNILDYEELANKIIEVMALSKSEKQERIESGLKQAKKFTWEQCTKETLEILNNT